MAAAACSACAGGERALIGRPRGALDVPLAHGHSPVALGPEQRSSIHSLTPQRCAAGKPAEGELALASGDSLLKVPSS